MFFSFFFLFGSCFCSAATWLFFRNNDFLYISILHSSCSPSLTCFSSLNPSLCRSELMIFILPSESLSPLSLCKSCSLLLLCPFCYGIIGFLKHWKVKVLVTQSCLTLCDPMDCGPPASSVHGVLQGRILEWAAITYLSRSSQPKHQTWVSCIAGRFFTIWVTKEALLKHYLFYSNQFSSDQQICVYWGWPKSSFRVSGRWFGKLKQTFGQPMTTSGSITQFLDKVYFYSL